MCAIAKECIVGNRIRELEGEAEDGKITTHGFHLSTLLYDRSEINHSRQMSEPRAIKSSANNL